MKTALWLYLFLFVAFFDLHAQHPILTPFAISLGAAPSFIGLMMGMYSITHLPGNLIAGFGVDRYGSRLFIVFSLLGAGIILLFQSSVTNPWQLLLLRSISGFVLAFLSPACLALLARLTSDVTKQGKLMAGNGLVHTLASVVSPAAGAYLVAKIGFATAFTVLGWVLVVTALCALAFIKDINRKLDQQQGGPTAPGHDGGGGSGHGHAYRNGHQDDGASGRASRNGRGEDEAPGRGGDGVFGQVYRSGRRDDGAIERNSRNGRGEDEAPGRDGDGVFGQVYRSGRRDDGAVERNSRNGRAEAGNFGYAADRAKPSNRSGQSGQSTSAAPGTAPSLSETSPVPWLIYLLPVALSCAQGILSFELPLLAKTREAMFTTGLLFSVVSIGALITLSMMFLNRLPAFQRTLWGSLALALFYFGIASDAPVPLAVMLLGVGMGKGIVLPALSTLLIELSGGARYGRTFSILSIAFSVGAFLGPTLAGQLRDHVSPYYIAFVALMLALSILPFNRTRPVSPNTQFT